MDNLKNLKTSFEGSNIFAEVSGRKYLLNGALPTSISVEGSEILAAPIRFRAEFLGEEKPWDEANVILLSQDEEKALYSIQQAAGNVFLNASVTIEKDGLIWVDALFSTFGGDGVIYGLYVKPEIPTLTSLKLEIPLKKEVAELFHYWPNEQGIVQSNTVSNSGDLKETLRLPLKPCLWLGKEEKGLAFYMESAENTQPASVKNFYNVTVKDDVALFTVDLLNSMPHGWQGKRDRWDIILPPIQFSMGFQATPIKPMNKHKDFERVFHSSWKTYAELSESEIDKFIDKIYKLGARWVGLHENWTAFQNYSLAADEKKLRFVVDKCHKLGIKVMVYFGYEYATTIPGFYKNYKNFLLQSANGAYNGGWQRFPHQRDFMACYAGGYAPIMLENVKHAMDFYGVDGIYTDATYKPWECANENHGCGYRDESGVLHETYPLRTLREHVKKLNKIVHDRGGLIDAHQSACCIPMILGYADSYYDGEHIQAVFNEDSEKCLDTGAIRSEFTGVNFGIPFQFLGGGTNYAEDSGIMLLFNSVAKVHGKFEKLEQASVIWKQMDDFGTDDSEFLPFWKENCPVSTDVKGVLSSVWKRKDGKAMAVVVNLTGENKDVNVTYNNQTKGASVLPLQPTFIVFEE